MDILNLAAQALNSGKPEEAIERLEAGIQENNTSHELHVALGICLQRIGRNLDSLKAVETAIGLNANDPKAWILKGVLHETLEQNRSALQAYQNAQILGQRLNNLPQSLKTEISSKASRIPMLLKRLESDTYEGLSEFDIDAENKDRRFSSGLDILFGRKQIYYQEPKQFYFPELPQREFYQPHEFRWAAPLMASWEIIRDEALALLSQPKLFRPYLETGEGQPTNEHLAMADNPDWSAYYLIRDGNDVTENISRCPHTMAALKDVDLCRTGGGTPSVLFSLLKAGAHIPPHNGMLNTRLICHLPVIVPPGCEFRVGNTKTNWVEGQMLIFDDSINHEAWNKSDEDRVVLLFDVWRPELTARERKMVGKLLELSNS